MIDRKVRRFVFTAHDWKLHDNFLYALHKLPFCYIIYGEEQGAGGSPHLQGYVELKKQMRISTINNFTFKRMWISMAHSAEASINYCKKGGIYHEYGSPKREVKKLAAQELVDFARSNKSFSSVLDSDPTLWRSGREYEYICRSFLRAYSGHREVIWLYGESGVGKTRTAFDVCSDLFPASFYIHHGGLQDFYGYTGQDAVIFDDYRFTMAEFVPLLRLFDRYPTSVNVKYGNVPWTAKWLFVTCPVHPVDEFRYVASEDIKQVLRRIDRIEKIEKYSTDLVTRLKEYITLRRRETMRQEEPNG